MRAIRNTISYRLVQVCRAHRKQAAKALERLGLYVGQEMLLMVLWERDGLTQSDFVEALSIEPPTVTKVLARMEKAGWVERRRDPTDARVSRVYLTDRGRALEGPVREVWADLEERTLAGCSPEERMLLRRIFRDMENNLSD